MKTLVAIALLFVSAPLLFTQETAPLLSLAKAAQLSEDLIGKTNLPPGCFLRSIQLVVSPEGVQYYRGLYKPESAPQGDAQGQETLKTDVIHVSMSGEAVFVQEDAVVVRRHRVVIPR